ncbi:MAG: hypothetical protein JXR30_03675, partial [Alphaproteobacteria bacterium]|nr:hypothetical protein [Alphaproteobacteria bacterium]
MRIKASLFSLFSLFLLVGCNEQVSQSVNTQVRQDYREATQAFERAKNPLKRTENDTISVSSGIWLGDKSVKQEHREPLPAKLETPMGITYVSDEPQSLIEIAGQIHTLTGIPVIVDDMINKDDLKSIQLNHTGALSELLSQVSSDLSLYWYYQNQKIAFYRKETKTFTL